MFKKLLLTTTLLVVALLGTSNAMAQTLTTTLTVSTAENPVWYQIRCAGGDNNRTGKSFYYDSTKSGGYTVANNGSSNTHVWAKADPTLEDAWLWRLEDAGSGQVYIINKVANKRLAGQSKTTSASYALDANDTGTAFSYVRSTEGDTNSFSLNYQGDSGYRINNNPGGYLCLWSGDIGTASGWLFYEIATNESYPITITQPTEHGTFTLQDSDGNNVDNNQEVLGGTTLTVIPNPATGYELDKVIVNDAEQTSTSFTVQGATTVTVTFKEKQYTIPTFYETNHEDAATRYLTSITSTGDKTGNELNYTNSTRQDYTLLTQGITTTPGSTFTIRFVGNNTGDHAIDIDCTHAQIFADWNGDKEFTGTFPNVPTTKNGIEEGTDEWLAIVGKEKPTNGATDTDPDPTVRNSILYDYTHTFTVPDNATVGTSRIRITYTDAWHESDANTQGHGPNVKLHRGLAYDIPVYIIEKEPDFYCTITYESAANGTFVIKDNDGNTINNGDQVPDGATLHVEATPNEGYMLDVIKYNDEDIASTYFTAGDENIKIEVQFTEAPTGYCQYEGSTSSSANRRLSSIALTGSSITNGSISDITTGRGHAVYSDLTSNVVETVAGSTIGITVDVESTNLPNGEWIHGYLYIDYNQDGEFADENPTANGQNVFNVGTTGIPAEGSELVSYSYFGMNDGYNGQTVTNGYDSAGASQDNNSKRGKTGLEESGLPDFVIPSTLKANTYRARFKMAWNSLDPCGELHPLGDNSSTTQNAINTVGGSIVDFSIKIAADPTGIEEVENAVELYYANGNIYTNVEGEIQVYDLSGKLVRRAQYAPVAVDDLANGIYIVRVNGNTLKFVK